MPIYNQKKVDILLNTCSLNLLYLCYEMFKDSFENNISHKDFLEQYKYYVDNKKTLISVNNDDYLKFMDIWNKEIH